MWNILWDSVGQLSWPCSLLAPSTAPCWHSTGHWGILHLEWAPAKPSGCYQHYSPTESKFSTVAATGKKTNYISAETKTAWSMCGSLPFILDRNVIQLTIRQELSPHGDCRGRSTECWDHFSVRTPNWSQWNPLPKTLGLRLLQQL